VAAGLLAAGASPQAQGAEPQGKEHQDHQHHDHKSFPRDHAGPGGPLGSPTDRGKLVPGVRSVSDPPVLVETPDLPNNLPYTMVKGAKEFHLHAQPVKRELLPGNFMNHWGYNGSMPGPTIQVTEGDRVRIVLHNELPEPTTLHLHGLELPIAMDGVVFFLACAGVVHLEVGEIWRDVTGDAIADVSGLVSGGSFGWSDHVTGNSAAAGDQTAAKDAGYCDGLKIRALLSKAGAAKNEECEPQNPCRE